MSSKRPTAPGAEEILGLYFPVLDHGFVALVDYMGTDECVERAARVSYGYGTRKASLTRGLIRYLRRHLHTTPSEMVELKFHCCMPMFVARQWIRHRTASVNEYSGRYSLMPMLFHTPSAEQLQTQSRRNNQGRSGERVDDAIYKEAVTRWNRIREESASAYEWLTSNDVAREISRIDLPLSTYTQWYWKIDLHNLLHFLKLRVDTHAQWEIQEYGKVMAGMLKRVAPLSYEAWIDYDVCGARVSRMELEALRRLVSANATDASLAARDGAALGPAALADLGLSKREAAELLGEARERRGSGFRARRIEREERRGVRRAFRERGPGRGPPSGRLSDSEARGDVESVARTGHDRTHDDRPVAVAGQRVRSRQEPDRDARGARHVHVARDHEIAEHAVIAAARDDPALRARVPRHLGLRRGRVAGGRLDRQRRGHLARGAGGVRNMGVVRHRLRPGPLHQRGGAGHVRCLRARLVGEGRRCRHQDGHRCQHATSPGHNNTMPGIQSWIKYSTTGNR